ncbi:hypothetical protein QQF64_029567 [Cirrhinus molitorella]|uniref:Uncharacterized protein n=2 Tax=Cirrhinus molitorella TaxID=172907 RepID=A0AA88QE87_9TELE|nr:hypothetical protein Q8A67_002772 [Cirrhinus molitorella]
MKKSALIYLESQLIQTKLQEKLDNPAIVRYVDLAEDAHFGYLALQLCEYTLDKYIQDHLPDDSAERSSVLKKLVKEVLCSLQVLHDQKTKVLHRDIKPQNVLIGPFCEVNILQGRYSLEHLDDDVAKDLVEWMINENPNNRPTVEQTLAHFFFWTDERRVEYLKNLGNQKEVENCHNVDEELLQAVKKYTEGKSFFEWKTKFPSELVQKLDGKKKGYPENTLGLLRFIRNLHEHYPEDADSINLMASFPDLFGSVFRFAKERGWNSRASLKKFFSSAPQT